MARSIRLDGRTALIAGGSNGIGAATAEGPAAEGARVVIGYHTGEDCAEPLGASLPGMKRSIIRFVLEVAAQIRRAIDELAVTIPRIDILVNSAGFTTPVPQHDLEKLDDALFEKIQVSNARGLYSAIRAAHSLLRASEDAVVISVCSISAFASSSGIIAYCAAKAALDTMGVSLAHALGPKIRVTTASPGAVATDFISGHVREALEKSAQATPLKRVVEPADAADAVLACITHLRATTGDRILVDGGRHL